MTDFTHLHLHTQYSILDGACSVKKVVKKAKELDMKALSITDHGVMYGVLDFRNTCVKEGIKPILGCEFYVNPEDMYKKDATIKDNHLILLAKNFEGYQNLIKLDSMAFSPNAFYRHARIDKKLLFEHSKGLICSSGCVAGIIPQLLLKGDIKNAEATALQYKEVFGDDYYIEIQNHVDSKADAPKNEDQARVLPLLIDLANRLNIKLLATNDVHFINKEDFFAHRILICLNTGNTIRTETKLAYTGEEYLKTGEQMAELFADVPQAISNTMEVVDKVEVYQLERPPILPVFDIPPSFGKLEDVYSKYSEQEIEKEVFEGLNKRGKMKQDLSEQEIKQVVDKTIKDKGGYDKIIHTKFDFSYLKYLTLQGAEKRYGNPVPDNILKRLDMELDTIEWMGFPGYFLIVQDFINVSRDKLGVIVGPGRGSAAGSVVAYCLGITQIEPVKYDLLFERFLNPDRISLPDIDVDFDNEGRSKALQYVQQKYGADHVAQITTFGTMAAKNSIRDVARVLELPLDQANLMTSYIPSKPGITLQQAIYGDEKKGIPASKELQNILTNGTDVQKNVLKYAQQLEGSIRNTGVHACGVIIGPDDISNYVPLAKPKDSDMMATQFEGKLVESVGMIKMDFLGLVNLSIIKDACENVFKSTGEHINIDQVDLEDKQTLALFAAGDTTATFQFESEGMKQHLKNLRPDKFEDLIAMNALYRPGPMTYIPEFIRRKHGESPIEYEFDCMKKYLENTYGITVYQEQVMQLSRELANFTPGEADKLRKAMGKKQKDVMAQLKEKYDKGCQQNGLDKQKTEKIWHDWEKFAEYAFNKSHATCYAYVAFQTGYLKAHYPAQYMSAVLTHNLKNITNITSYIADCQKHGIDVLGPNVNESDVDFMVNKKGQILFGLAAIKSVGVQVALSIIEQRKQGGLFKNAEDFVMRNLGNINRRCIEALVKSGAFDCFDDVDRSQYFVKTDKNSESDFIDKLIRYCIKKKQYIDSSQASLFGEQEQDFDTSITFPKCEPMSQVEKLRHEKEMIGFYISGHPLDIYADEIHSFVKNNLTQIDNLQALASEENSKVTLAGMITKVSTGESKSGKAYGKFTLEDKLGSHEFYLSGKDLINFSQYLHENLYIFVKGKVVSYHQADEQGGMDRLRFQIEKIELLEEMFKNYATSIKIKIDSKKITDDLVAQIVKSAKNSQGNKDIIFDIFDSSASNHLTMEAKKYKVDIPKFSKQLNQLVINGDIFDYVVQTRTV